MAIAMPANGDYQEMVDAEVTLIVFDNSWNMQSAASLGGYHNQLEAIDLYCHAKLQSNPENAIGIFTMGGMPNPDNSLALRAMSRYRDGVFSYLEPTSDVDKIMAHLHKDIKYGGDLDLSTGIPMSLCTINQLKFKHKRLLFFVGGYFSYSSYSAKVDGRTAKKMGVAVDVVTLCLLEKFRSCCKIPLDTFVAAANVNGNSHIKHVPPASYFPAVRDALASIITLASIKQGEIALAAWKKLAREKEDKENHPIWKGKRNLKEKPAPPPLPPAKVPRIKSLLVSSKGNQCVNGGVRTY